MDKIYHIYTSKDKKTRAKEWAKFKAQDVKHWVIDHKEVILTCTPVAIGAANAVAKFVRKRCDICNEQKLKDLYCYDPRLGHYWELKRKLTNSEWIKIEHRKERGENLGDILRDLKVLK